MASSTRSIQFGTGHHAGASIGAFDDDLIPNTNQMGAAHPVHQGVEDVSPLSRENLDSVGRTTMWRSHKSGTSIPQPYSKRTSGSFIKFDS